MTREDVVAKFHKAMNHPIDGEWTPELLELRMGLIQEETQEIMDEGYEILTDLDFYAPNPLNKGAKLRLLKEMADLQYVLSGMAVALGLPLEEAFNRVHQSNMTKLDDDGKPVLREDGKVMKGPNYVPPVFWDLIDD